MKKIWILCWSYSDNSSSNELVRSYEDKDTASMALSLFKEHGDESKNYEIIEIELELR